MNDFYGQNRSLHAGACCLRCWDCGQDHPWHTSLVPPLFIILTLRDWISMVTGWCPRVEQMLASYLFACKLKMWSILHKAELSPPTEPRSTLLVWYTFAYIFFISLYVSLELNPWELNLVLLASCSTTQYKRNQPNLRWLHSDMMQLIRLFQDSSECHIQITLPKPWLASRS